VVTEADRDALPMGAGASASRPVPLDLIVVRCFNAGGRVFRYLANTACGRQSWVSRASQLRRESGLPGVVLLLANLPQADHTLGSTNLVLK